LPSILEREKTGEAEKPQGFMRGFADEPNWVIARNNPLKYIDPSGLICGTVDNDWAIPDYVFGPACKRHDACYSKCGNKKHDCDMEFLRNMFTCCKNNPQVDIAQCNTQAYGYWFLMSTSVDSEKAYREAQANCRCK